ncbi:hypothetical protein QFZ34_002115 [Phyllobacterium ifriqiyense]|uniref:Uncharacterized protein n=1 Tax=Phyllobacterium ifriqiyense TaxID=314238 RepID=A0ABU0S854_9HYPH|nr:hypothetical protein [Phyllobacterium ifriqiyense]MDQ0996933.1 hypothetical protein [Phyllobacterium ifriqiyense]
MTAPNNPTPEVELEPVAWAFNRPETPYQFWTTNPEADNLKREKLIPLVRLDQVAAAISRLTAERDGFEARLISCDENLTHTLKSYTEMTLERDRAERRVKELEANRDTWKASRDRWKAVCVPERVLELEAAEASNKLLSERVAVLEGALEPAEKLILSLYRTWIADDTTATPSAGSEVGQVYYDLRRARDAREGK